MHGMNALTASVLSIGVGASLALIAPPASAEPMETYTSCKQLRAAYPGGIAKTKKAKKKIVKRGYRSPIVCPRVYKQVRNNLDRNRNGVACERK